MFIKKRSSSVLKLPQRERQGHALQVSVPLVPLVGTGPHHREFSVVAVSFRGAGRQQSEAQRRVFVVFCSVCFFQFKNLEERL